MINLKLIYTQSFYYNEMELSHCNRMIQQCPVVIRGQLNRLLYGSEKFRKYWFGRPQCKAVRDACDLYWTVIRIIDGFSADIDTEDGRRKSVMARFYLWKYGKDLKAKLVIPKQSNIDKEEYQSTREDFISAWNELAGKFSWEKFKEQFPEFASIEDHQFQLHQN